MINRPIICSAASKADVLERRRQHLLTRSDSRGRGGQGVSYDLAEASALGAAVEALAWYAEETTDRRGSTPLGLLTRLLEVDVANTVAIAQLQAEAKELLEGMIE